MGHSDASNFQTDDLLKLGIKNLPKIAVFLIDAGLQILSWNKGAEELLGYTAEDVKKTSFTCFFPDDPVYQKILERYIQTARTRESLEDRIPVINKKQDKIPVHLSMSKIQDATSRQDETFLVVFQKLKDQSGKNVNTERVLMINSEGC